MIKIEFIHMVILNGYVMCRCGQLKLVANNSCWGCVCNSVLPHLTLLLYLPRVFMVCVAGLSGLTGFHSPFFIPLGRPQPLGAASGMLISSLLIWYGWKFSTLFLVYQWSCRQTMVNISSSQNIRNLYIQVIFFYHSNLDQKVF